MHARLPGESLGYLYSESGALDELLAAVQEGNTVMVNRRAQLGRNTMHTIQLVEECNRRGVHFQALDLGIGLRTPANKMIIRVSFFNQYEREHNRQRSLAGNKLAKQQGPGPGPARGARCQKGGQGDPKALERGLLVAEIVTRTGISRASVQRYRHELLFPPASGRLLVASIFRGKLGRARYCQRLGRCSKATPEGLEPK